MEPKTIKINDVEYVRKDEIQALYVSDDGLEYCIVRCHDAGVHAGFVKERNGREVTLLDSRRLWRWHGRTLSGVALEGPDDLSACKFGDRLPSITVLDACEIIPCTGIARQRINEVDKWVNS